MGKLVMGYWDCNYCKRRGIEGTSQTCPSCGHARGAEVKFYMKDHKNYIDETEVKSQNPDWLCEYCGAYNSDVDSDCTTCGASKTAKTYHEVQRDVSSSLPLGREGSSVSERRCISRLQEVEEKKPRSITEEVMNDVCGPVKHVNSQTHTSPFLKFIDWKLAVPVVFPIAILITIFAFLGSPPKEYYLYVDQLSWEREIKVEELKTFNESGWNLPSSARLTRTSTEIKEYNKVLDHYETKTRLKTVQELVGYEEVVVGHRDLGNGVFEEITQQKPIYESRTETETYQEPVYRNEPVYATKYYYEIDRWTYSRSSISVGCDKFPQWKEPNLKENERKGGTKETYTIKLTDKETEWQDLKVPFSQWNQLEVGSKVKCYVKFGKIKRIELETETLT